MKTISYAILAHKEHFELDLLLEMLQTNIRECDEIVIVLDNPTEQVDSVSKKYTDNVYYNNLNNDFSQQKNFLNSKCTKDYIFNIDADELPSDYLIQNIESVLHFDLVWIPRINIVNGITLEHIKKWKWSIGKINEFTNYKKVDSDTLEILKCYNLIIQDIGNGIYRYYEPLINWPFDYQGRIYKNSESIKWIKPVHEYIIGAETITKLPSQMNYSLYHIKDITRQEKQNKHYEQIIKL